MLAYEVSALLWELLWEQKTLFPIAAFSLLYPTKPDLAQVSFCPASVKTQTPEGDISTTTALVLIKSERLIVQLSYIESKVEIAEDMKASSDVFNNLMADWTEDENPLQNTYLVKVKDIEAIDNEKFLNTPLKESLILRLIILNALKIISSFLKIL